MHKEILIESQLELLPLVKSFSASFGLVGGTAVALHLGHRRSIDFDLFIDKEFSSKSIREKIKRNWSIQTVIVDEHGEFTLVVNNVKLTFFRFPYKINYSGQFEDIIKIPDVITLAAMKAFALGRRAKWKDYVDIFFVLKSYAFEEIARKAKELFGPEFNERLFREQLSYYKDVDYSEAVEFMGGREVSNNEIQQSLTELSLA